MYTVPIIVLYSIRSSIVLFSYSAFGCNLCFIKSVSVSVPQLRVTPLEFCWDLLHQKTAVPGLSHGVVCVILCLPLLTQYQRVTDEHTETHDDHIYRASIASSDKNVTTLVSAIHTTWLYPFQEWFAIHGLALATINLSTTFEVSISTHYKDIKRQNISEMG